MRITRWLASLLVTTAAAAPVDFGKPAVVLVHGIFDSGPTMGWLAGQFAKEGYETFCPSLTPSNGSASLSALSAQLDAKIRERFPASRRLHVIAFSMGGLISRHWLQNHADLNRIDGFATLSSPHQGTWAARVMWGAGVADMRHGSDFLAGLEREDERLRVTRPLSLFTPFDLIILPATSSRWKMATVEVFYLPAHPLMMFDKRVAARLLSYCREREGPGKVAASMVTSTEPTQPFRGK